MLKNKLITGWVLIVIGFLIIINAIQLAAAHETDTSAPRLRMVLELVIGLLIGLAGALVRAYAKAEKQNSSSDMSAHKATEVFNKVNLPRGGNKWQK